MGLLDRAAVVSVVVVGVAAFAVGNLALIGATILLLTHAVIVAASAVSAWVL